MTHLLYLEDAYLTSTEGRVEETRDHAVSLDRTVIYPTGGGQPHDTGELRWNDGVARVIDARSEGKRVWVTLDGPVPPSGTVVTQEIDWGRRHQLMRTHTAVHVLCGVIWNEWGRAVTGGSMEPLSALLDLELDPLPEGFREKVEALVNEEIAADRPLHLSFLPREEALADPDLIRTKVDLIPPSVAEIRVVEIEGLDRQADGGTHVRSTSEVGRIQVTGTESKGRHNKRIRFALHDA